MSWVQSAAWKEGRTDRKRKRKRDERERKEKTRPNPTSVDSWTEDPSVTAVEWDRWSFL